MPPEVRHSVLVGLNFNTAAISLREKMGFAEDTIPAELARLQATGVDECVILSTCNRVELYGAGADPDAVAERLVAFICSSKGLARAEVEPCLYIRKCEEAVTHLFTVAASIDSMIVGEYQILGQLKRAYALASESGTTGSVLNKLFQSAVQVGKKVRTETEIGQGSISVGSVAVSLVREIFPENSAFRVLLIGAGEVAALTAEHLCTYGRADIHIASRTAEHARALAERFGGSLADFDNRHEEAAKSDIVIVSTAAPTFVLERKRLAPLLHKRERPVAFYIDLSVPRNIDPEIHDTGGVILYSIDDLKSIVEANARKRSVEVEQARLLINESAGDFGAWYAKQKVLPLIQSLREHHARTRDAVLKGASGETAGWSDEQRATLLKITDKLIERQVNELLRRLQDSDDRAGAAARLDILRAWVEVK